MLAEHVQISKAGGAKPVLKIPTLIAGMIAGADWIDDMALLRHGAMARLFGDVRAPSTLGTCASWERCSTAAFSARRSSAHRRHAFYKGESETPHMGAR